MATTPTARSAHQEASVLSLLKDKDGKQLLAEQQVKELLSLAIPFDDGDVFLFDMTAPERFYELMAVIQRHGYGIVPDIISLVDRVVITRADLPRLVFRLPTIQEAQYRSEDKIEYMRVKPIIMFGLGNCPNCGSNRLSAFTNQARSADEMQTSWYTCTSCKHKWRVG